MSKKARTEKQDAVKAKVDKKSAPESVKVVGKTNPPVAAAAKRTDVAEKKQVLKEREVMLISKALADPTRLAIFRTIARGGASCGSIKDCIAVSAATLSHHMKELETAGLIETSREGRFMHAALQKKVWKSYLGELKSFTE